MQVHYTAPARKMLKRLPKGVGARILDKIEAHAADPPAQANNVRALKGSSGYRLRVGDYRVLFRIEGDQLDVMTVYRVGHRKDIYDG